MSHSTRNLGEPTIIGKDVFFNEPIGQCCPDCGDSYMQWKVGEETIFQDGSPAVVESNDAANLVFKITDGPFVGVRVHYTKGLIN